MGAKPDCWLSLIRLLALPLLLVPMLVPKLVLLPALSHIVRLGRVLRSPSANNR